MARTSNGSGPPLWPHWPLLALGLVVGAASGWPASAGAAQVPGEVDARAAQRGSARVIVELAMPAPSTRSSSLEDAVLRLGIAWEQQELRRRVGIDGRHRPRDFADRPILAFDATPAMLAQLTNDPLVVSIESDRLLAPSLIQSIVTAAAETPFAAGFDASGVAVAILDTGVEASHSFFGGRIVDQACFSAGSDCPNGLTSQFGTGAAEPCTYSPSACFHGTHVAGIAAGWNAERHGVAPGVDVVAVQIFSQFQGSEDCPPPGPDPCPLSYTSDMIAGLLWANGLTGITLASANLSLGGGLYSNQATCDSQNSSAKAAIDMLVANGTNVAAASGNDGSTSEINAPACISSAIAVGGIDDSLNVYGASNSNALLDYVAPAVSVTSSTLNGGFGSASGTSMSTPHIAGAIAVLRSLLPLASATDIRTELDAGPAFTDPRNGLIRPRLHLEDSVVGVAPGPCFDGLDNDSDGDVDHAADPGCVNGFATEAPQCDDGVDNDSDGQIDWDGGIGGSRDLECFSPIDTAEAISSSGCGAGPELAILLPLLAALRRRQRSRA